MVASTHSARLHAAARPPVEPNAQAVSSHRSASRTAATTASLSACVADGSLACATVARAVSLASAQFTLPS